MLQVLYPIAAGDESAVGEVASVAVEGDAPAVGAVIRFRDGSAHHFVQRTPPGGTGSSLPVARGGTIRFGDFETDARMALVKVSADGDVDDMLHIGGTFVRRSGD